MATAILNGVTLNYQRRPGRGPEIVFVHGLATNMAFWYLGVVPLLKRRFCITLFDLRGHGRSDMPRAGYSTRDMAEDLHALVQHLGLGRFHLVGHSYGGAVALHYAVLHPERVATLTLADARIRALQPTQRIKDWPNAEYWEKRIKDLQVPVPLDDPEMGYRFIEALAEAKVQGNGKLVALNSFSPFGSLLGSGRTAQRWLQLLRTTTARSDFEEVAGLTEEKIRQVDQQTLAIFGEFSNCLASCRGLKEHLPHCRIVIIPRAGHFHPAVKPRYFTRSLISFLRKCA